MADSEDELFGDSGLMAGGGISGSQSLPEAEAGDEGGYYIDTSGMPYSDEEDDI